MSNVTTVSSDKEKKRRTVSTKSLLNIKTIVTQNVSSNRNNKNTSLRSGPSSLAPLPLVDSLVSSKDSTTHLNGTREIEEKKRKKPQTLPNRNVVIECLQKTSTKQILANNGHDPLNVANGESQSHSTELPQISTDYKDHQKSQQNLTSVIYKELNCEQYSSSTIASSMNNTESSIIPPLPLNCSMYPFNSSTHYSKPLLSFPVQPSNRINEEYLTQLRQIVDSPSSNSIETKTIELSIHRHRPIHSIDSASPTVSTLDDDEDGDINLDGPLVFINSSSNLSKNLNTSTTVANQNISTKVRLSDRSEKDYSNQRKSINNPIQYQQPNPRCSTSYTRLPHSLRNLNLSCNAPPAVRSPTTNQPPVRRPCPQFESVRTPVERSPTTKQESSPIIPWELLNCCQTETVLVRSHRNGHQRHSITIENNLNESEVRSNYFRSVAKLRETMMNVSRRLTNDHTLTSPLPIVDTHCHFDLIFDRLHIKHNSLKKYFQDYNEFYPAGLSFELAIQVFWRPRHLTENNWTNRFSKYLDDERVYGSCGIHPHWSSEWNETSAEDIERCLEHPKIVAIGEIGLDYGPKNLCSIIEQRRAFQAQLILAAQWWKPIVIHSRNAYKESFQLMKKYLKSDHKIHLHCFVGTMKDVDLFTSYFTEIKFGFTPIITRDDFLHQVIQQLELTQILSETDSPYFIPHELSTLTRCAHPGMVYSVVEMVAQLRHLPIADVASQLRENARVIYGV